MSIILHAIAFILWALVVFFTAGLGASSISDDRKSVMTFSFIVIALFVLAFTLQVIA